MLAIVPNMRPKNRKSPTGHLKPEAANRHVLRQFLDSPDRLRHPRFRGPDLCGTGFVLIGQVVIRGLLGGVEPVKALVHPPLRTPPGL
jgi:hypothetical protein